MSFSLLARPRFSAAGRLLVGAVLTALVGGACASPAASQPPASSVASATTASKMIRVKDFRLDPMVIDQAGPSVALQVMNDGPTVHNVQIRDEAGTELLGSRDLREDETDLVTGTLPGPGEYVIYCSLPGHESLGIKGKLIVS